MQLQTCGGMQRGCGTSEEPYHQSTTLQCSNSQTCHTRQQNNTMIRPRQWYIWTQLIWRTSVPNRLCGHLSRKILYYGSLQVVFWLMKVWTCTIMSQSDAKQCTKWLDTQHSHSRSVDHASDANIGSVHVSTCPVLGTGCTASANTMATRNKIWQNIGLYVSTTTVVYDGYEEWPLIKDDTSENRTHYTVVSFTADIYISQARRWNPVKTHKQTDWSQWKVMNWEEDITMWLTHLRCRFWHCIDVSVHISSTYDYAYWRRYGYPFLVLLLDYVHRERIGASISDKTSPLMAVLKCITSIFWTKILGMTCVLNWYSSVP